jgi:hypothetical protein
MAKIALKVRPAQNRREPIKIKKKGEREALLLKMKIIEIYFFFK